MGAQRCRRSALQTLQFPKGTAQLTVAKLQTFIYPLLNTLLALWT